MKFYIVLALVSVAYGFPAIEDTQEVQDAKEQFHAAFEQAEKGAHQALAPKPVSLEYLADTDDVAKAKAEFNEAFEAAKNPKPAVVPAPVAVAPVAVAPVPAALSYASPYQLYNAHPNILSYNHFLGNQYYPQYYAANYHNPYYHHQYVLPVQTVVKPQEAKMD